MRQVQTASDVPESEVEQSQFTGDPRCCQNQATNLASMADITQMTNQLASDPDAVQDAVLQGDCDSTGSCHVFQSATIDGDTESNECGPAPSCHIFTFNSQG